MYNNAKLYIFFYKNINFLPILYIIENTFHMKSQD